MPFLIPLFHVPQLSKWWVLHVQMGGGDICVTGGQRAVKEDKESTACCIFMRCCSPWLKCEAACVGAEALAIEGCGRMRGDGVIAKV